MSNGCTCHAQQLTPDHLDAVDKLMEPYRGRPGNLIQVLHKAQNVVGYLPREVQVKVAEGLNVPLSKVYGVVSFYSFFNTEPKGKHKISICAGTACYVRGAKQLINKLEEEMNLKPGGTSEDGLFSLDLVRCVGACGLGPVVTVDDEVYGQVDTEKLISILSKYKEA